MKTEDEIIAETTDALNNLGIYRDEFAPAIERYASVRVEYAIVKAKWQAEGRPITVKHTNKNGATNDATAPLYIQVQKLRAELTSLENQLGLTPAGLKKIKDTELVSQKKMSRFEEGLRAIEEGLNGRGKGKGK